MCGGGGGGGVPQKYGQVIDMRIKGFSMRRGTHL